MTSGVTGTPGSGGRPADGELAWHTLGADQVLHSEGVDGQRGLSSAEAAARAERFGPNMFAAGQAESRWRAFLRQYADPMQLVLLAAGIGSLYPLKQLGTGLLLILLTLFNAVMGLQQEGKAAAAVAALQKMVIIKAKVRRDGQLAEIPARQLVPGNIVTIEAGDIVPANNAPARRSPMLRSRTTERTAASLPVGNRTRPSPCLIHTRSRDHRSFGSEARNLSRMSCGATTLARSTLGCVGLAGAGRRPGGRR